MRAAETSSIGSAGHTEVKAKLERLGQGPIEVPQEHDLGLDLLVQARDERRFDAGLLFGVQVKSGSASKPSKYFCSPSKGPGGVVDGWWYRDKNSEHFDSWIRHGLPVILVLHDLDTSTSYWAEIKPERIRKAGKGFKLCVPADQLIDSDHLPALLEVAASIRAPIPWEGSAWLRDGQAVSPGDRLRHALLVPRLMAPHRNAGFEHRIGPEEALALLAQARFSDLDNFASRHASVPTLEDAAHSENWTWRLVGAYGAQFMRGHTADLRHLIASAPGAAERAATIVIAVCALVEENHHTQALELLSDEIEREEVEPIDYAWLLVQRARVRTELGDEHGAGADAALARITVLRSPNDPTASAIAAAAAESIFRAARWGARDIEAFIKAIDTAASWWRAQRLASAYEYAIRPTFDRWAQSGTIRFPDAHPAYNELEAARWTANLSAHVGNWRACLSLLARQMLLDAGSLGQGEERELDQFGAALELLRISGDASALTKAVHRLRRLGPVEPAAHAVKSVVAQSWPAESFRTNLALWEITGDLLPPHAADAAVAHCTALLNGDVEIPPAVSATTDVEYYVLRALAGVIQAAPISAHEKVRDMLVERSPWRSPASSRPVMRLLSRLAVGIFSQEPARTLWRDAALRHTEPVEEVSFAMLGRIADADHQARQVLMDRIKAGNIGALTNLGDIEILGADVGQHAIHHLAQHTRMLLGNAAKGTLSHFGIDFPLALAMLNSQYPQHAEWDVITELLGHPSAPGDYKRGVCIFLARSINHVPDRVRSALREAVNRGMISSEAPPPGFTETGGAEVWLRVALGLLDAKERADWKARLLTGNWRQRADAVYLAHLLHRHEDTPALVALLADPHYQVRIEAAHELAHRANRPKPDLDARAGLVLAAGFNSVAVPKAVAEALAGSEALHFAAHQAVTDLMNHPSAVVRRLADIAHSKLNAGESHDTGK